MTLIRNTRSEEGIACGKEMARFYEQELSKRPRELDGRCDTCACRLGSLPNGSTTTQMDFLKCIMEGVDFVCHEKGREGTLCHGYKLLKPKLGAKERVMDWPFSDEIPAPANPEPAHDSTNAS